MPTGYTIGIINGEIETFQEFAKQCMRAFGATIHMKEESIDKEYLTRDTSKNIWYYLFKLKRALKIINNKISYYKTK